ncbi:hypothetical protein GGR53DRAFT_531507 [Hypoxylon sp. FL1150]|nr:hypothetical protein GGR53DRAFT_531507 [Hypoxylon sp. FL1150]
MCQDWRQEYTGCNHVSRKLINCPTYYKQQNASKGFFGHLFYRDWRNRKHCSRVIPHYAEPSDHCSKCTFKHDQLQANYVGDGALTVTRSHGEYDLRSFNERLVRQRTASRWPSEMSDPYFRSNNAGSNYTPQGVRSGQGVWVPELYHNPLMLAQNRSQPARPLPLPQPLASRHSPRSSGKEKKHQARSEIIPKHDNPRQNSHEGGQSILKEKERSSKEKAKHSKERERSSKGKVGISRGSVKSSSQRSHSKQSSSLKRTHADGHSKRHGKPIEPEPSCHYQRHGKCTGNGSSWTPPVPRTPPTPAQDMRQNRGGSLRRKSSPREFWPHPSFMKEYPALRRKQGQVFKAQPPKHSPTRSPVRTSSPFVARFNAQQSASPTVRHSARLSTPPSTSPAIRPPLRVPTPKYLAYLRAQREAARDPSPDYGADTSRVTMTRPIVPPKPPKKAKPVEMGNFHSSEEKRRSSFLRSLTFGLLQPRSATVDSDISFVCTDAKKLTRMRSPRR